MCGRWHTDQNIKGKMSVRTSGYRRYSSFTSVLNSTKEKLSTYVSVEAFKSKCLNLKKKKNYLN